jgi:hypothetical protein
MRNHTKANNGWICNRTKQHTNSVYTHDFSAHEDYDPEEDLCNHCAGDKSVSATLGRIEERRNNEESV